MKPFRPLLVLALAASGGLLAQPCRGPAELERDLAAKPSAAAYNAKGAYFAAKKQLGCALAAFEAAVRLEPGSADSHFNLGLALRDKREDKRAMQEFRTAVRLDPAMEVAHRALGTTLLDSGQAAEAETEFQTALRLQPRSTDALDGLSKSLIEQKRYTAALEVLKQAPPADPGLQMNLAVALTRSGNPEQAVEVLKTLLKADPSLSEAHSNLAVVYALQNRFRESADEYHQSLRLDPANDVSRIALVRALVILGEFQDALPFVQDYVQRHAANGEGYKLRGEVYRGLGEHRKAETDLRRALLGAPDDYDVRYNLGFVLAKLARPLEALPHLEKAKQLRPDSTEARFQLATVLKALKQDERARVEFQFVEQQKRRTAMENVAGTKSNQANVLLESGDVSQAIALYREVLQEDPKYARGYYNLAVALGRTGQRAEQRKALEQAVALDAKLAVVHNELGLLDLQDRQFAEAEARFKTALALDPQYAEAQSSLGVLYGQQGKAKEAEELLRKATVNNPKYAQGFVNLGLLLAAQGKFALAEKEIISAVILEPNGIGGLTALGMAQSRQKRTAEAVESFRKVALLAPKSPEAHLNFGIALADAYNLENALTEFTESLRLSPDLAPAHYFKGRSLFDLKRTDEARADAEAAVKLAPGYAPALYLLALIEKQAGNAPRSTELLRRVVAVEPNNGDALYMLGQNLARMEKPGEAIEQWKHVLAVNPGHAEALYNLSRALAKSAPAEASRYQQQFKELQQKRQITDRAEMLGNFAITAAAARDWAQAVEQFKEALEVCGECRSLGDLHKNLGLIYCKSGDLAKGRLELEAARKLKPNDPDIEQALLVTSAAMK